MAPPTPAGLTATANSTQINLSWSAATGAATYSVKRSTSAGPPYTLVGSRLATTTFSDSGVMTGMTYYYVVSAINSAGESANSSQVSATAAAPVAAGCTPDIAIPSTASQAWPNSCTTGASDDLGTLTSVTGDITLDQQGQLYKNMRVDGSITVLACDVKMENVEVDAGVPYSGNSTPDVFPIWLKHPAGCNVTLDHVSVITKPAPNVYVTNAIRVAYGGAVTITNSKLIGTQLGYTVGPGTIKDSYAVLGATLRGDHNEVILEDGTSNLTIEHNTFLNPNPQTSVLSLFTEFGPNSNIVVHNNLIAGGGYTCYCGDGKADNAGKQARAVNVSFENNVFWRLYYPDVGFYGPGRAYNGAGGGRWVGNLYMNSDGTLAGQPVPQPPIDQ
jgi:hypothetical protein